LFLTRRADGTPLIKVLDFGIAKTDESDAAESSALTSSDDVRLGSPAYMPPEQLQNPRDVDTRSDIWSLGATLYELLCGRPPFEGPGYLDLATHVLQRPPRRLAEHDLPHPLPEGLEQVVLKCLEKERSFRYSNAADLATALARYGSADARMSLTRVSGMFASSSSFPALTRALTPDPEAIDPTLDVSSGAGKHRHADVTQTADVPADHRSTSNIKGADANKSSRVWLGVVLAAVAGVAFFVVQRAPGPPVAATTTNAALVAPPPLADVPKPVETAEKPPETVAVPTASVVAPKPLPPSRRGSTVKPTPSVATSMVTPPLPPPTPPIAGRSEEIERLIEKRH
jgi:serine/threonine-protein kinase